MRSVILLILLSLLLIGCAGEESYFVAGTPEQQEEIRLLMDMLEDEPEDSPLHSVLVQQVARTLLISGEPEKMRIFLTDHVQTHPVDPVNGYYLYLVAQSYEGPESRALRSLYLRRVVRNYPDVEIDGISTHLRALEELVNLVEEPSERVAYYQDLLERFSDRLDPGELYYRLARSHEDAGEWPEAYQAYRQFLRYPDTRIPGAPHVHRDVAQMIAFYDSGKEWTMNNLDDLVEEIKRAIYLQNTPLLLRYRAETGFFTMSWEQEETDFNSQISSFNIGAFLRRSRVSFDSDLDISSNAREAYLRTWGWSHRIPVWYLYFRRVDYPADPEIHGDWEWGGIYFGESL
ncbi:MAG: tetratricopeptide repeat protein [Alkalispirochaetaceae bacterium]